MVRREDFRLFVCGGHDVRNSSMVRHVLAAVRESSRLSTIVETGDRVGMIAREWASDRSIAVLSIFGAEADWLTCTLKVERLLAMGHPDLAVSFDNSQRSLFFLEQMSRQGVRTCVIPDKIGRRLRVGRDVQRESDPARP